MRPTALALLAGLALAGPAALAQDAPPKLGFPLACKIGRDCEVQHYVDRDPGPGARDYNCGHRTYDKHDGIDIRVLDMAQQRRGVDVLAAAAGKVIAVRDGVPDISIRAPGAPSVAGHECGNRVAVSLGGGWLTDYCHLAKGSLRVKVGDEVQAGQPLAKVGLSGDTEFPHLHMSLRHGATVVDPFDPEPAATTCGVKAPLWTPAALAQLGYKAGTVLNMGFAPKILSPEEVEAGGVSSPTAASPAVVVYARLIGLQAGDVIEVSLKGPPGASHADQALPPLDHDKDQYTAQVGLKRPAAGWKPGAYAGEVRVRRAGKVVLERRFTIAL